MSKSASETHPSQKSEEVSREVDRLRRELAAFSEPVGRLGPPSVISEDGSKLTYIETHFERFLIELPRLRSEKMGV